MGLHGRLSREQRVDRVGCFWPSPCHDRSPQVVCSLPSPPTRRHSGGHRLSSASRGARSLELPAEREPPWVVRRFSSPPLLPFHWRLPSATVRAPGPACSAGMIRVLARQSYTVRQVVGAEAAHGLCTSPPHCAMLQHTPSSTGNCDRNPPTPYWRSKNGGLEAPGFSGRRRGRLPSNRLGRCVAVSSATG